MDASLFIQENALGRAMEENRELRQDLSTKHNRLDSLNETLGKLHQEKNDLETKVTQLEKATAEDKVGQAFQLHDFHTGIRCSDFAMSPK